MAHQESWRSFGRRVEAIVGVPLKSIPEGEVADLRRGKVICRRNRWYVVRVTDSVVERENDLEGGHTFEAVDYADHYCVVKLDD